MSVDNELTCKMCGHVWLHRGKIPRTCTRCKSYKWNVGASIITNVSEEPITSESEQPIITTIKEEEIKPIEEKKKEEISFD